MIGRKLRQARLVAGMTQQQVVDRLSEVGVRLTKAGLSKYERGRSVPKAPLLFKLAQILGVRPDFLVKEEKVSVEWLAFRSHASLGEKEQERIRAFAQRILEGQVWLQESLFPGEKPVFPKSCRARTEDDAEKAAARLREEWRLGDCPVESVTEVIEENGGIVIDCPLAPDEFDGLAGRANGRYPVTVISSGVPDDRRRFDLAHELGHLTMDCRGVDRKQEHRFAHRFAAAFIVPPAVARRELGNNRRRLDLHELALLKLKHGLSMQAWIRRASDLNIITQSQYGTLVLEFSRRGWRKKEPVEFRGRESPMRLRQMTLRALAEGMITPTKAEEFSSGSTKEFILKPMKRLTPFMSAVEIMRLPKGQRERILAEAAKLAEKDYVTDPDMTDFNAFADEDLYD